MDFGFVFMGDCHIHPEVKYAEDNGFSHAWLAYPIWIHTEQMNS